jgi:tetratricopeptide (TPR) repeat protein
LNGTLETRTRLFIALACVAVFAATVAVYWQTRHFEFTHYDDQEYVTDNPHVTGGLNAAGLKWALTTRHFSYWHPVTWISHQADCQFFGLDAGKHHLVSVFIHALNGVLCLLTLGWLTGFWARSAMVAAAFALHPLHVESVAWISERKDLVSGFFFFATLAAYGWYARGGGTRRYLAALGLFALGIASKPMLVTMPCLLFLIDYWPLHRLRLPGAAANSPEPDAPANVPWRRLIVEKVPFFALSFFSSVVTFIGVRQEGRVLGAETFGWLDRLANVPVSYVRYLGKMIFPGDMVYLYPIPGHWELWQVAGACVALLFITLAALAYLQSARWLIVGWLWFLGMLAPTLNVVAVGLQSIADRYTYLPLIGVFIMVVWAFAEASKRWPKRTWIATGAALLASLAMATVTHKQARVWQNSLALFGHAVAASTNNPVAHYNLGVELLFQGRAAEAAPQFRAAIRAHEAGYRYNEVHRAHNNLGFVLNAYGRWNDASNWLAQGLALRPDDAELNLNFGRALLGLSNAPAAVNPLTKAARMLTKTAEPGVLLGQALARAQKPREAVAQFRSTLAAHTNSVEAMNAFAWLLATSPDAQVRDGAEALRLAHGARALTNSPATLLTLAAALAEAGQMPAALEQARAFTNQLAGATTGPMLKTAEALLRDLEAGRPYRDEGR